MTSMRLVSLNLPVKLIAAIGRAAHAAGVTPHDLVRSTLHHVFAGDAAGPPKPPQRDAQAEDEQGSVPPFAVQLAFTEALGWLDLQSRLRAAGFVLRLGEDGVLALHTWPADHRLIDSAALGQPLADLTLRFRAAFPGQVLSEGALPGARAERRLPTPPCRKGRAA
ncbi:hypothetical protein [Frigidibacter sp.]|uniref:hypothetical protein n=1 Tax=Frigidibacter sp. TaxID=2586418 RepID=UPI0027341E75|nr:hypothetical protein [Frigidibacter sp.]